MLAIAGAAENPSGPFAPMLQSLVDRHVVAGVVVLVADKDKMLDVEAAGFSSLEKKRPVRTDALFWIASMTKSMTGTALMMLVDEGKLSLDDPVEKYLPEFKGQMVEQEGIEMHPPQHPITVREVMDHTSGLVTPQDPALKHAYSLKENVAQFAKLPLQWEPGSKFQYNNCGINTGARVLEVVSGVPYAEFMQQQLFTPLGMKDTTFWPIEEQASRLASSTKRTADKSALEDLAFHKTLTPAGIAKFSQGVAVPTPVLANFGMSPLFDYANHFAEAAGGLFSTAGGGCVSGPEAASISPMSTSESPRPPLPPFDAQTAAQKVRMAEDAWNTREPGRVALAYTPDSVWRNRAEFLSGREAITEFLTRKWNRELEYRLIKELWAFHGNRIAVRFAYEWHDDSGHWFRSYGNENWEFDANGFMQRRIASINDLPIREDERKYRWPLGRRPDEHPGLSELGL